MEWKSWIVLATSPARQLKDIVNFCYFIAIISASYVCLVSIDVLTATSMTLDR
jgi:hypothetical protein